MTNWPTVRRLSISGFMILAPIVLGGCSGSSSSSPSPSPAPTTTTTASAVSAGYTSSGCPACHGATGTTPIGTPARTLKGTALTAAVYSSKVRSGVSGTAMEPFTAAQISDANIASDYSFFTH